jgi:hypothetical protein
MRVVDQLSRAPAGLAASGEEEGPDEDTSGYPHTGLTPTTKPQFPATRG